MMQRVQGIPGEPHRWADEIAAWAHGLLVQARYENPDATDADWQNCDYQNAGYPNWDYPSMEYRVAPSALQPAARSTTPAVQPLPSDHVCGLQGFDGMRDECPGCERNRARRAAAPTLGTDGGRT